jgi:nitrite reductase/ring-hydroxylating ferredoxin subunit
VSGDDRSVIDVERVICRVTDLESRGSRAFTIGRGDWPLRGLLVSSGPQVYAYVNHCPHAGHPLDLVPGRFLTADGNLILCSSHGALFEKASGYCVAGPCAGKALTRVALKVDSGFVMLADEVDVGSLMPQDTP